jgi:plastocyanin
MKLSGLRHVCVGIGITFLSHAPAYGQPEPVLVAAVEIDDVYYFTPATRNVKAGDTIRWINLTDEEHTITPDDGFQDKLTGKESLAPEDPASADDEYSEAVKAGPINYHCEIHPLTMKGVINVE